MQQLVDFADLVELVLAQCDLVDDFKYSTTFNQRIEWSFFNMYHVSESLIPPTFHEAHPWMPGMHPLHQAIDQPLSLLLC